MSKATYTPPPQAYECVSYWLVFCGAGCGAWLSGGTQAWSSSKDRKDASPFADQAQAWQAAMSAGWANVPLPNHKPHQISWWTCDGSGAGDCSEVRAYKDATVCPACRAGGWMP